MKKPFYTLVIAILVLVFRCGAQTLFTYGSHAVDVSEFQRAYQKNNPGAAGNKEKSIREYLGLYINSKLKIAAAYEQRLDSLPALKEEIRNIREQIIGNYLIDPEGMNLLMKEAFERSQKDIRVSHIFIPVKSKTDTAEAAGKIKAAYTELKNGKSFEEVALAYSQDPSVKINKGDIGFITVFSLPYYFESAIYSLRPGNYSQPVKSDIGYHIFKNSAERKAAGRVRAAQILLGFPPGSDETIKKKTGRLADSLYQLLQKGADFAALAKEFSNDYISAASGGMMQEFGVGAYDPAFEQAAFGLKKDGEISQPVLTEYGYHIIKRITKAEIPSSPDDKSFALNLKTRIEQDERIESVKEKLYQRIITTAGFKESAYNRDDLWKFSDSLLNRAVFGQSLTVSGETPLFRLGEKMMTALDWIAYAQSNRYSPDGSGLIAYPDLLEKFKRFVATEYYRENLEKYNDDFRIQMNEFKDGTLFFEIMTREVWNKAQTDSAGQQNFFEKNKNKYNWKQSAAALIFYCTDTSVASDARKMAADSNFSREEILKRFGDKIVVDSGRFELEQIPGYKKEPIAAGKVTGISRNSGDETATFARIVKMYTKPEPKNFADARGAVINDYQEELDKRWTDELKKKYPVKVDERVLKTLFK